MKDLSVSIVHNIPGRLRLRLTKPPRSVADFIDKVVRHDGIESMVFNPVTLSVLIPYRPAVVSPIEITMRVGIALSLEYGNRGVGIAHCRRNRALTPIDYYGATSLVAATISYLLDTESTATKYLKYNAGYSTLIAVLNHAITEVKKEGIYDPEVISVVYLINSLIKGNYLFASAATWLVTFSRHLVIPASQTCVLEATQVTGEDEKEYVEVVVNTLATSQFDNNPMKIVLAVLGRMMGFNSDQQAGIMEQVKEVAKKHGNVLEGFNQKAGPVYLRMTI